MMTNNSSGLINSNNLNYMNKIYEIMKDAVIYDSEQNRINIVYNIKKSEIKTNPIKEKKNIFKSNDTYLSKKKNKVLKIYKENNTTYKQYIQIIT